MAFRRNLGNLAGTVLENRLKRRDAEYNSSLVGQRQSELAMLQDRLRAAQAKDARNASLLTSVLGDPAKGNRLAHAGVQDIDGLPISGLSYSPEEATGGAAKDIAGITNRAGLPTDEDIQMANLGRPGFDPSSLPELFKQRDARRGALDTADQYETDLGGARAQVNAQGSAMGKEQADATNFPAQLGRDKQKGMQTSAINVAEQGAMNPVLAQRAGMVAGAQNDNSEWLDPRIQAAKLKQKHEEGMIAAAKAGDLEQAKIINEATNVIASVTPDWERMQKLSKLVNTDKTRQVGTEYITAPLQINQNAHELDSIAQNMGKRLANNPLFGGNKGAQSEKDSQAIADRLPNSGDSAESALRKIASWNKNMYQGLDAMSKIDRTASPQDKINAFRASFGLPPVDMTSGTIGAGPNAGPSDNPDLDAGRAWMQSWKGGR